MQPLAVTATEAELAESTEPTAAITAAPPARIVGASALSYKAGDGASGVERVEVLLDDVVVGLQDFSRNLALPLYQQTGECTYTGISACRPRRLGGSRSTRRRCPTACAS
jgi:hypothetical protein